MISVPNKRRRRRPSRGRNVLVIGDVHGCADELTELLAMSDLDEIDLVVFAGDLVDKGPNTVAVVKMARKLSERMPVVLVEGNHEEQHRRFRRHLMRGEAKAAYKIKDAEFLHYVTEQLNDKDLAFLDTALLYYPLKEHNAIVVHGGIPPKLRKLPPKKMSQVERLPPQARKRAKMMQQIRYVTSSGAPVEKGKGRKRDKYWADIYDGRFGVTLFGHQPFKEAAEPVTFPHAVGLDLGCASGNALGGAILRPGQYPQFVARPAAAYVPNAFINMAMPHFVDPGVWVGYQLIGTRWVPVVESCSADEALSLTRELR